MNTPACSLPIVLASTSPFRRELLSRLALPFECIAPDIDESRHPHEPPLELVRRLSEAKARAGAPACQALVIGSDQVATVGDDVLGKPGTHERAAAQLRHLSGRSVTFLTGLCLLNTATDEAQVEVIPFRVHFRTLGEEQIERYLRHDLPYNCAGSFKSEGLGITLFERMEGDDPTTLVGLPLIRLTDMLTRAGVRLP
ncbi:MAG: nucleoside triphosphate pyrophosphatase [Gammaproteobacteria bacterium]